MDHLSRRSRKPDSKESKITAHDVARRALDRDQFITTRQHKSAQTTAQPLSSGGSLLELTGNHNLTLLPAVDPLPLSALDKIPAPARDALHNLGASTSNVYASILRLQDLYGKRIEDFASIVRSHALYGKRFKDLDPPVNKDGQRTFLKQLLSDHVDSLRTEREHLLQNAYPDFRQKASLACVVIEPYFHLTIDGASNSAGSPIDVLSWWCHLLAAVESWHDFAQMLAIPNYESTIDEYLTRRTIWSTYSRRHGLEDVYPLNLLQTYDMVNKGSKKKFDPGHKTESESLSTSVKDSTYDSLSSLAILKDAQDPYVDDSDKALNQSPLPAHQNSDNQDRVQEISLSINLFYSLCRKSIQLATGVVIEDFAHDTQSPALKISSATRSAEQVHSSNLSQKRKPSADGDYQSDRHDTNQPRVSTKKRKQNEDDLEEYVCFFYAKDPIQYKECGNFCSRNRDFQSYRRRHLEDHWRWGDVEAEGISFETWNAAKHASCSQAAKSEAERSKSKWVHSYRILWNLSQTSRVPDFACEDKEHEHYRPKRPLRYKLPSGNSEGRVQNQDVHSTFDIANAQQALNNDTPAFLDSNNPPLVQPSYFPEIDAELLANPGSSQIWLDSWSDRELVANDLLNSASMDSNVETLVNGFVSKMKEQLSSVCSNSQDNSRDAIRGILDKVNDFETSFAQAIADSNPFMAMSCTFPEPMGGFDAAPFQVDTALTSLPVADFVDDQPAVASDSDHTNPESASNSSRRQDDSESEASQQPKTSDTTKIVEFSAYLTSCFNLSDIPSISCSPPINSVPACIAPRDLLYGMSVDTAPHKCPSGDHSWVNMSIDNGNQYKIPPGGATRSRLERILHRFRGKKRASAG